MPVRSLTSSLLRWPSREAVRAAVVRWAQEAANRNRSIRRIGYFGSCARGDWGVGSDVDLVLVLDDAAAAAEARIDTADLPVPADVLVFAESAWQDRLRRRDRFAQVLRSETVWVFGAPPQPAKPAICGAVALLAAALLLAPNQPAAAQADSGGHPGDPYFALDHVLDVAVEMAPADWDRLRRQRNITNLHRGGAECWAQPFPQAFSWFAADVTVDGRRYGGVGIRKRGQTSSATREKPGFKIAFDKSAEHQALGGVLPRITLINSITDSSLLNTCLAYQVFAAAGLPAPRCNYARVAVNGEQLGLYVHVEEIERSLLQRAFADAGGNLYEGMSSDFRPEFRGTIEKETNRDAGDWSDVDAVVAALQDPTPAGLKALAAAVDLDRFLTFWAVETLIGHWDGYTGNLTHFHFYREPDGRFVFIPWGVDQTFIRPGAPAVLASGAIANRLYRDAAWRAAYAVRLRELLDTVWDETELLRRSERMAALVQAHALPERRGEAARGADRVRGFIRERRAEVLAAMESGPQDWEPLRTRPECWGETSFDLRFETTWGGGSLDRAARDPAAGTVTRYLLDGVEQALGPSRVTADWRKNDNFPDLVAITLIVMEADSGHHRATVWLPRSRFVDGSRVVFRRYPHETAPGPPSRRGVIMWSAPPGATERSISANGHNFTLDLYAAGTTPGAAVSGRFHGVLWGTAGAAAGRRRAGQPQAPSLIINEVAARGEPRDWFELYNASGAPLALADFMLADDLTDRSRRIPFLTGLRIEPGAYLRVELDSDRWPGFALGRGEELGIWTWYGRPVAQVDWQEGDSRRGTSYARVPDLIGPFRTVSEPTPGAPNAGALNGWEVEFPAGE